MADTDSILAPVRRYTVGRHKHPAYGTGAYTSYHAMMTRCYNPKTARYPNYGGRGIKVCDRWQDGFPVFFEDMGQRPDGMSLDRIDPNGDYSPSNCRWATKEQQINNKQDSAFLEHDGRRMTVAQWAPIVGLQQCVIRMRLKLGWTANAALTEPSRPGRNQYDRGEVVEFGGKNLTWNEWATEIGIGYYTLKKRMENGWGVHRTLSTPLEIHRKR